MAKLNVGGEIKAPIITATETINCDTTNVWFGGAKAFDSGSNANGYWVRFADGTQICTGTISQGSSGTRTSTFANAFSTTDNLRITFGCASSSGSQPTDRMIGAFDITKTNFSNYNVGNRGTYYMAIGRWK